MVITKKMHNLYIFIMENFIIMLFIEIIIIYLFIFIPYNLLFLLK